MKMSHLERHNVNCPHCAATTTLTPAPMTVIFPDGHGNFHESKDERNRAFYEFPLRTQSWIGRCHACRYPFLIHDFRVYPIAAPSQISTQIPEEIRSDLIEARECLSVSAWNAAGMMARRAVQTFAVLQGAVGGTLHQQIGDLRGKGVLTQTQKDTLDAVRWTGNVGAHPELANIRGLTKEDATDVVDVIESILTNHYEVITKRDRLRAAHAP